MEKMVLMYLRLRHLLIIHNLWMQIDTVPLHLILHLVMLIQAKYHLKMLIFLFIIALFELLNPNKMT